MKRFRHHSLFIMLVIVCAMLSSSALAQEAESAAEQDTAQETVADSESGAQDTEEDEARSAEADEEAGWELYQSATDHLADGDEGQALDALETLAAEYPEHPATKRSANTLEKLREKAREALSSGSAREAEEPALGAEHGDASAQDELAEQFEESGLREPTDPMARAEFVSFQTLHGIALGVEVCAWVTCDSPSTAVGSVMLGGGAGLGLSLWASSGGVTPGFAATLNSGAAWGAYHGVMFSLLFPSDDLNPAGSLIISQAAGLGLGALLWNQLHPLGNEVAMANSFGGWAAAFTLMGFAAGEFEASAESTAATMLAVTDLALVGGALLSQSKPVSRSRLMVIDSGGILGALTGMGLYFIADPYPSKPVGPMLTGMLGSAAGLGLATFFTRNWDAPEVGVSAQMQLAPVEEGMTFSLTGQF